MTTPIVPFRLILICDADAARRKGRSLRETTNAALDALTDDTPVAFLIRDKTERADEEIAAWAAPLVERSDHMGGPKVIVHTRTALATRIGAHALHFADGPLPAVEPDVHAGQLVGQSVHQDTSLSRDAHFGILAPIFAPTSKRAATSPLGLATLNARARATPAPLFALGGITLENAAACISSGAHGVAVLGAWLFADDIGAYVRDLLANIEAALTA